MDPVTLGAIGIGAGVGGSLLGAFGSIFSGNAGAQAYQYKAGVARMQQQVAMQNASWAREAGEQHAMLSGLKTGQEMGKTFAKDAASGLAVGSGSSADVIGSIHASGVYDANMLRYNAAKKAYGFEVEAAGKEAEARMDEYSSKYSKIAGWIGAGSSLLGGASSVSDKWMAGRQTGLWS